MKDLTNKFLFQFRVFLTLTKRHIIVFCKNWTTVLFTMMVPMIILVIYVLFLRDMEIKTIDPIIKEYVQNPSADFMRKIYALADSWMIAGVLAVSCITVSLNTNSIMVRDKERGISKDFLSSPISSRMVLYSYFAFNTIVTFLITFFVLCVCMIYLACYGAFMISVMDFFALVGIILLSTMNAALLTFFICTFINKESSLSAILAIFSAAVGFLIGAYLPTSILPDSIQCIIPGTYSAALFRNYLMSGPMDMLKAAYPEASALAEALSDSFSFNLNFFGSDVSQEIQAWILGGFTVVFAAINIAFTYRNYMRAPKKKKQAKKSS